jgi:hypothetical protein
VHLATLHFPDPNPFGPPSVAAVLVAIVLVALSRSEIGAGAVKLAPALLLLFAAFTAGSIPNSLLVGVRSFPDADDLVAWIIYQSFGLGFAVHNFRLPGRATLLNAAAFTIVHGGCLVLVAVAVLLGNLWPGVVFAALFVVIVLGSAIHRTLDVRRHRRLDQGLCAACAYDLRGSRDSGACPECGARTPWARGAA